MGAYKPSTLVDFQAGRPLEIEAIWGEPLRRAAAAGAFTPRLQELYKELKTIDSKRLDEITETQPAT
jgi:2-dehydropantoate 2-reductase